MTATDASIPNFDGCVYGTDWEEPSGELYDSRSTKRGNAIAYTASERGVAFTDVKCRVIYARWITREEVWSEHGGNERWLDDWMDEHGSWVRPIIGGRMPAHWQLGPEHADQNDVTFDDQGEPQMPDEPPEDWEPDFERHPAWEPCDKSRHDGVKCYLCEVEQ